MKHLIRFASIALVCGLLACLTGCSCSSTRQEAQKEPVPTESDGGTVIDLDGGWVMYAESNLLVVLDENATTGYSWTSAIEGSTLALYRKNHQRRRGVSGRGREPRRRGRQPSVLLQGDGRR